MFAMLISSHLIYNCTAVLNAEMIRQLSLVTEMSKRIRLSDSNEHSKPGTVEPKAYKQFYPALTVLVRDFSLDLKDPSKKPISPDEYLHNAIAQKPGQSEDVINDNFVRAAISDSFPLLNCFVMCRPTDRDEDLKRLNKIPIKQLKQVFQDQLAEFKTMILSSPRVKMLYNKVLSGQNLIDLADNISKADIPVIQSAYHNMCKNECIEALNEALSQFVMNLDKIQLPVDQDQELEDKIKKLEKAAKEKFNERCNCDQTEMRKTFLEELKIRIAETKERKVQENRNIRSEIALREMTESIEEQKRFIESLHQENLLKEKELKLQTERMDELATALSSIGDASEE